MSWFRKLFVKSEEVEIAMTAAGAMVEESVSGTFITEQSLVTFVGATFVSGMVSGVLPGFVAFCSWDQHRFAYLGFTATSRKSFCR